MSSKPRSNRYSQIIARIFLDRYKPGATSIDFERDDLDKAAEALGIAGVDNLGDLIYSFRYRSTFPEEIASTATEGHEWIIDGRGRSKYRFLLSRINRIAPSEGRFQIKIPDALPQIVARYTKDDEQALLATVRYNRLVDLFLRVTAYHLQGHLRTTMPGIGQIETDDMCVAVRNSGQQFIIPIQAKTGNDQIGIVQIKQDLALCQHAFPQLTPRPVAVQFVKDATGTAIVMFELTMVEDEVRVVDERHYRLVPAADISPSELAQMASLSD